MTETLQGVQDKATADAAAEKFAALVGELDRFGPSAESDAALADERVSRLAAQVSRLAKEDCFESEALKRALGTPAKSKTSESRTARRKARKTLAGESAPRLSFRSP